MGSVLYILNCLIALWLVKAGPAAVGVKLSVGLKQKGIAASAVVAPRALLLKKFTGVGTLGAGHSQHVILEVTQLLAPLFVSFEYFVVHFLAVHAVYNLRITTFIARHFQVRLSESSFNQG